MADDETKTDTGTVTTDGGTVEGDVKSSQFTEEQLKEIQTENEKMKAEIAEAEKGKLMREMEIEQLRKMSEKSEEVVQETKDSDLADIMITEPEKAIRLIEERTKKAIFEDEKFVKLTSRQDEIDRMREEQSIAAEAIKKMGLDPTKELSENAPAIEQIWRTFGKNISVLDAYNRAKIDKGELKVVNMREGHEVQGGGVTETVAIERKLTTEEESWFNVAKIEHDKARKEGEPEFTRKKFAENLDKRFKEEGLL